MFVFSVGSAPGASVTTFSSSGSGFTFKPFGRAGCPPALAGKARGSVGVNDPTATLTMTVSCFSLCSSDLPGSSTLPYVGSVLSVPAYLLASYGGLVLLFGRSGGIGSVFLGRVLGNGPKGPTPMPASVVSAPSFVCPLIATRARSGGYFVCASFSSSVPMEFVF